MSNPQITCLSLDCPERKSVCCGAGSIAVTADEGTSHFACKNCGKEFIGGKCNAEERMSNNDWEKFEKDFDQFMMDFSAGSFSLSQRGWEVVKSYIFAQIEAARAESYQQGLDINNEITRLSTITEIIDLIKGKIVKPGMVLRLYDLNDPISAFNSALETIIKEIEHLQE